MKLNQYTWDPEKDLIAEGAFAEVFKALDTNTQGRVVALKIYKEAVAKGASGSSNQKKYSLEEEFRKIDGLSHTNIISYYGQSYIDHKDAMGRSSSYPVIVMEYAQLGTLSDFLKTKPSGEVTGKLIREIIEGVGYLHSEGIIHRDLKPGNVLVTQNRRGEPVAKITDFGISRDLLADQETLERSLTTGIGTPHYMAPEQFFKKTFGLNQEISERTDFWALGVIIYRLFTNRLPFGHGVQDYEQVRDEIVNTNPDLSALPAKAKALVMHCLRKHAERRPENIGQLLDIYEKGDLNEEIEKVWVEQGRKAEAKPDAMPSETDEVPDLPTIPEYKTEPGPIVINDPPKKVEQPKKESAGVGSRFLASMIDSILFYIFSSPILFFIGFITYDVSESRLNLAGWSMFFLSGLSLIMLWAVYHSLFEKRKGRTPGKRLMKLKVSPLAGSEGQHYYKRSFVKYFITPFNFVSTALLLIGIVGGWRYITEGYINETLIESTVASVIFTLVVSGAQLIYYLRNRIFLHDKVSGMVVVKNN